MSTIPTELRRQAQILTDLADAWDGVEAERERFRLQRNYWRDEAMRRVEPCHDESGCSAGAGASLVCDRCGATDGGGIWAQVCTYRSGHGGPHSWDWKARMDEYERDIPA